MNWRRVKYRRRLCVGGSLSLKVWVREGVARTFMERSEECWGRESWNCQRRELTQRKQQVRAPSRGWEWFSDDMPRTKCGEGRRKRGSLEGKHWEWTTALRLFIWRYEKPLKFLEKENDHIWQDVVVLNTDQKRAQIGTGTELFS